MIFKTIAHLIATCIIKCLISDSNNFLDDNKKDKINSSGINSGIFFIIQSISISVSLIDSIPIGESPIYVRFLHKSKKISSMNGRNVNSKNLSLKDIVLFSELSI